MCPDFTGDGMDGRSLHISVSISPDFWFRIERFDKRVIRRHFAGIGQANTFTRVIIELLCALFIAFIGVITAITKGDNHEARAIKHDARAEVLPCA